MLAGAGRLGHHIAYDAVVVDYGFGAWRVYSLPRFVGAGKRRSGQRGLSNAVAIGRFAERTGPNSHTRIARGH